jgi:hypothetical protein
MGDLHPSCFYRGQNFAKDAGIEVLVMANELVSAVLSAHTRDRDLSCILFG